MRIPYRRETPTLDHDRELIHRPVNHYRRAYRGIRFAWLGIRFRYLRILFTCLGIRFACKNFLPGVGAGAREKNSRLDLFIIIRAGIMG